MSRLLLVRHANTVANSAERFWGHTDVELSQEGIRQAEKLRNRLAKEKIDAVYASPLRRAVVTAEIVASGHQLRPTICAELHEVDFGQVEGMTFNEISQRYPELVKAWPTRDINFRFPGGESIADVNERLSKFLDRVNEHAPEETVLIVAHAGPLRLLICHLLGLEPWHWRKFWTDIASLSVVNTYPGGAILNLLNDVSHLK